jgi:hypothetical protein
MSAAEILEGLSKLNPVELNLVHERILELEESQMIDPSAEFSAAIEEGMHSLRTEPSVSLDEVRQKIGLWSGRSA